MSWPVSLLFKSSFAVNGSACGKGDHCASCHGCVRFSSSMFQKVTLVCATSIRCLYSSSLAFLLWEQTHVVTIWTCQFKVNSLAACRPFTSNIVGKLLQYKIGFIHTEYSLKIHWARLRPLLQCERNLGCKYFGPDGARATAVGLR